MVIKLILILENPCNLRKQFIFLEKIDSNLKWKSMRTRFAMPSLSIYCALCFILRLSNVWMTFHLNFVLQISWFLWLMSLNKIATIYEYENFKCNGDWGQLLQLILCRSAGSKVFCSCFNHSVRWNKQTQ